MQVKLTLLGGPSDGLSVDVSQCPITLGRDGDRSLPVDDRWASRFHCELTINDDKLIVRDLASKHGTYVNGERVEECVLEVGDRVIVGLTQFSVSQIHQNVEQEIDAHPEDRPSGVGV